MSQKTVIAKALDLPKNLGPMCLVQFNGGWRGRCYLWRRFPIRVGRALENDLVIPEQTISRVHAFLEVQADEVWIQDVGSSNGTFLYDKPLTPHQPHIITNGDMLRLGSISFKFYKEGWLYETMQDQAFQDPLTQVGNRRLFEEKLKDLGGEGLSWHLMYIDLDHFKRVNDTWGHNVGDEVLVITAKRLKNHLREQDFLARIGGEEFAIIIALSPQEAMALAHRILSSFQDPMTLSIGQHTQTMSIGMASWYPEITPKDWMEKADEQLYRAKEKRNCVCS